MDSNHRLNKIADLLYTALDCEEEYLYEGEMSQYMRSYAGDATWDLRTLIQQSQLTSAEIEYCVAELSKPERIARGSTKRLLAGLGGDYCLPLLEALANSNDPQLRIFALKIGYEASDPRYYSSLCPTVTIAMRLLDDPNEDVRVAAASTSNWMQGNAEYLAGSLQTGTDNPIVRLFYQFLARLNDPSAKVRAAVAKALGRWAREIAHEALIARLELEEDTEAQGALAAAIAVKPGNLH